MAVARVLGTTERKLDFSSDRWRVHINNSGLEIPHGAVRLIHIPRVDRSRQAVLNSVSDLDGFVKIIEGEQRDNRAEDFFLSDAHAGIDVSKNRGLVEPAVGQL